MQKCRPPSPQDAGMILPSMGDGIPLTCLRSPDPAVLSFLFEYLALRFLCSYYSSQEMGKFPVLL
jgi:hypothetical protein